MKQEVRRNIWVVGLIVAVWLCGVPGFVASEGGKSLEQEIEQEKTRLKELEDELRHTKEKAQKVEREKESVLKNIEGLDRRLIRKKRENKSINQQLKKKDQELAKLNVELTQLRSELNLRQNSIAARLRILYMEGRGGYVKALLTANSFANFQRRLDVLSTVSKQEYVLLEQFRNSLEKLEELSARQVEAREELLAYKKKTEKKIHEIKGVNKKKRVILTSLSKEKELHEQAIAGLERSAQQVDSLLKELDQRFNLSQSQSKKRLNLPLVRGSLLWPVQGEVVSFFGRQKHPTFDTYVNKKGIEIETHEGSPIRTVSPGQVVYADWLKGYGLVVIMDHSNGFFSLYAHASKLLVKEGDSIKKGQVIGEAGETGVADASSLYFELRKGTKPVDPLKWLVKRP